MNSKVMMMAALAICGCARMEEGTVPSDSEMVELSFHVPCQKTTKVSGSVVEDAVEDLQIFVFGLNGQLQAYGHAEDDELTLTCTTGDKRVAAIVNAPLVGSNVTDETSLNALSSSFSENAVSRFVMSGMETKKIESTGTVTVPVSRLVSKVVLTGVKNNFELDQHKGLDFKIKSAFLINTPKDRKFFSVSSPTGWINKGVSDISQIISSSGTMMYQALNSDKVAHGSTYAPDCSLYCYPNPLTSGMTPTYLVVEATLGNALYYYPVDLPAMEANKCYNVALTVCRPGSSSPDVPVEKRDVLFDVQVKPWDGNVTVDEII